jgi:hypothetical protein
VSAASKIQRTNLLRLTSSITPSAVLVKIRSTQLLLARKLLHAAAPSLHSLRAKANNRSDIRTVSTRTLKSGRFSLIYIYVPILTYCSAHLVKWVTENNRPINIINDRELRDLLTAGRPSISLPTNPTISRDIDASFEKCRERISKLLQVSSFFSLIY